MMPNDIAGSPDCNTGDSAAGMLNNGLHGFVPSVEMTAGNYGV